MWRAAPADFPPWRTVDGIYQRWNRCGGTHALHDAYAAGPAGRTAKPTAAVIDSRSVRAVATVANWGWDEAKKINGCKRHIAVDAGGLPLEVLATSASIQDRDVPLGRCCGTCEGPTAASAWHGPTAVIPSSSSPEPARLCI